MPKQISSVTPSELKSLLDSDSCYLIDVREPDEYQQAAIDQAELIPLGTITEQHLEKIQHKKVAIHCKSGGRSMHACEKLAEQTEKELINLEGGIIAWAEAGLKIIP